MSSITGTSRRRRRRSSAAVAMALVLALVASACGTASSSGSSPDVLTFSDEVADQVADGNVGNALREPTGCPDQTPMDADPELVLVRFDVERCLRIEAVAADADADALRVDPGFVSLSAPIAVSADADPVDPSVEDPWGHDVMRVYTGRNTALGEGVVVAIVDSGVDAAVPTLQPNLDPGLDFTAEQTGTDDHGHGTGVAMVVANSGAERSQHRGVAPAARILPMKVLDADGSGTSAAVAQGIVNAVDRGADVILVAVGAYESPPEVEASLDYAFDNGVVVVASAGNDGERRQRFPAANDGVIAVSGLTEDEKLATTSNFGSHVTFAAPNSHGDQAGTSIAAAYVAGSVASLMSKSKEFSLRSLFSTARDLGPDGFDEDFGIGVIDLAAAIDIEIPDDATTPVDDSTTTTTTEVEDTTTTTTEVDDTTTTTSTTSTSTTSTSTSTSTTTTSEVLRTTTVAVETSTSTTSTTTTTTTTTTLPPDVDPECYRVQAEFIEQTENALRFVFFWDDCGFDFFQWQRGYRFVTHEGEVLESGNAGSAIEPITEIVLPIIDPNDQFAEQMICLKVRPRYPGEPPMGPWSDVECVTGEI